MWVGESERQVRDLFSQCRERANDGALAFLFIDEAESILGTRRAGRYSSILSTLVPMFCTEMDGLVTNRRADETRVTPVTTDIRMNDVGDGL